MNKLTLKYELAIDFNLIAITSPLKDYRLCYFINKVTALDLRKIGDHEIWINPQQTFYFGRFTYEDVINETAYFLLNNKGIEGGILIPEMKATDFFLLIQNAIDEDLLQWQISQINHLREVVVATEINPHKLKSKENLVF
ncbi:IPExxxVDY family protein [Olivibacter ginsenosidimutans]|uniref:IPExxxVDY family protein n=1 Tax=Olivibacter ginsenosidimutans TaxID=1176537 RepID=A0ABP9AJ49_9SPHI